MSETVFDLAIIGGGINGVGIARDAAGRGLSVFLCEQGDLGGATSSASTKLIHGGLRYLETGQFRLVREGLEEREVLLRAAPHIIRPLRLILPHHAGLRPRWMLRLGLLLYDHMSRRQTLPPARMLDLRRDVAGEPLKSGFRHAFEFSDCEVDDSRLVILNAIDARARGARIDTRMRFVSAKREGHVWSLTVEPAHDARRAVTISARALINATGPWVGEVSRHVAPAPGEEARASTPIRLVKGSHIVVPRLFQHDRSYMFQHADGRVVFAIPFQQDFTLIGTTEEPFEGDPATVEPGESEIAYLCSVVSEYFRVPVPRGAVVWSYAGVRPLQVDGARNARDASRDYRLDMSTPEGGAPLVTIVGGKITTYRRLAEAVLARLRPYLAIGSPWTAGAPLPGGDFSPAGPRAWLSSFRDEYPFLSAAHASRLAHAYGTRASRALRNARRASDLGRSLGGDLTEAEVSYLLDEEWAETADDILWRRSKLGLRFEAADVDVLEKYLAGRRHS